MYLFLKKKYLIQQGLILIKSDLLSILFIMLQKMYILKKKILLNSKNLNVSQLPKTFSRIEMISEGSCDTEDWSNYI